MIAAEEEKAAEDIDLQSEEAMHHEAEHEEGKDYGCDGTDGHETEWETEWDEYHVVSIMEWCG